MMIKRFIVVGLVLFSATVGIAFAHPAGAAPAHAVTWGEAVVASDYADFSAEPIDVLDVYPQGVKFVVAILPVEGLEKDEEVEVQWFKNGDSTTDPYATKFDPDYPFIINKLSADDGLSSGDREVRFSYNGEVVASAEFKIADVPVIYPFRFGEDFATHSFEVLNPATAFPKGTKNIAAVFRYANLPDGAVLERQWIVNGKTGEKKKFTVDGTEGTSYLTYYGTDGLAGGNYEVRVFINGKLARSGKVTVAK